MRTRAQLRQLQRSCPRAKHPSPQKRPDAHACPVVSATVLLPARKAPISPKETRCARVPSCVSYSTPARAQSTHLPKGDPMRTRAQLRQLQRSCPRAKHPSPQRRPDAHACPVASATALLPARKAPISPKETRCARVPSCVSCSAPARAQSTHLLKGDPMRTRAQLRQLQRSWFVWCSHS
jgi:hypothetical protein